MKTASLTKAKCPTRNPLHPPTSQGLGSKFKRLEPRYRVYLILILVHFRISLNSQVEFLFFPSVFFYLKYRSSHEISPADSSVIKIGFSRNAF